MDLKNITIQGIDNDTYLEMLDHFTKTAPESYGKTHYDLANETGLGFDLWKKFLGHPDIKVFVKSELEEVTKANTRAAKISLGDATSNTDIAKTKQLLAMQKEAEGSIDKPFNLIAFPVEVAKYRNALENIREHVNGGHKRVETLESAIKTILDGVLVAN